MKKMLLIFVISIVLIPFIALGTAPPKMYVTYTGAGLKNGASWVNAFDNTHLQAAINAASSGTDIYVAKGTYKPTTPHDLTLDGNRDFHFRMRNSIYILGGFAGTESSSGQRVNYGVGEVNETILSGDIGTVADTSDNCYHVFYHPAGLGLTSGAYLDGFTITGGNAGLNADPHKYGGGMYNNGCSPTLVNVTFLSNNAFSGGGMFNVNSSSPALKNVLFFFNNAVNDGGGLCNSSSSPTVTNVTFSSNTATSGGALNNSSSSPTINNCIFWGNEATSGKEIYINGGTTTLNYSCYSGGTNDTITTGSGILTVTNHNITTNPRFADVGNNDLRLVSHSPCINTGYNSYNTTSYDIRGRLRIQNTTIDMGAYEWTSGVDPQISNVYTASDTIVSDSEVNCFNGLDSVNVAGDETTVTFESGSIVTIIAGKAIRLLPGFWAESGCAMDASITTTGSFCEGVSGGSPVVENPVQKSDEITIPEKSVESHDKTIVRVHPNPNNGQFTIALTNIGSEATVTVYNILGSRVYHSSVNNQTDLSVNLPELQKGIYFVKVVDHKEQFTKKDDRELKSNIESKNLRNDFKILYSHKIEYAIGT